ncbi:MAG: hypothetical protein Tsb004_07400 [Allomuricauda sp.]
MEGTQVEIRFLYPFSFHKKDSLFLDELVFTHVDYLDSISLGNYLPNQNPVILNRDGKQLREKSNQISMARVLGKQLSETGNYKIINGPELLTSGTLKISKTNGEPIKICVTPNYLAAISVVVKE